LTTPSQEYDVSLAELAPAWELELERDALGTERDTWRKRAEDAEQDAARANSEADTLRTRVQALESTLEQHRALTVEALSAEEEVVRAKNEVVELRARVQVLESTLEHERELTLERSETTRRAAIAIEHAHSELERLGATRSPEPVPRRPPRGNWLR
jgi:hypothetical protein